VNRVAQFVKTLLTRTALRRMHTSAKAQFSQPLAKIKLKSHVTIISQNVTVTPSISPP